MIIRRWRGEIALWKAFWLFGVGGGLLLALPIFSTMMALTDVPDVPDDNTALIIVTALGFLLVYLVWVFVGIWRSATGYQGDRVWAVCAKIAVGLETAKILLLVTAVLFAETG